MSCANFELFFTQAISKIKIALNGYKGSRIADLPMMVDFTHTGDLGKIIYVSLSSPPFNIAIFKRISTVSTTSIVVSSTSTGLCYSLNVLIKWISIFQSNLHADQDVLCSSGLWLQHRQDAGDIAFVTLSILNINMN